MDHVTAADGSRESSMSSNLLRAVQARDAEAWRRLSQLFGPEVYSWARTAGLQPTDASDVLQEVFWSIAANVDSFRRDRPGDSFRAWLWTVARNKIRDHFRRLAANDRAVGGSDAHQMLEAIPETTNWSGEEGSSTSAPKVGQLSRRALDLIHSEFEEPTWQAFWRVVVDGVPAVEVAGELGTTPGAVRQAKYRVLRRLRQEMDGLLE